MYNSIELNNFKSFKHAAVKLPSFGAIVGRNAAGKTNFIQAIQFIRDLATSKSTGEAQKSISLIPNELFNFNEGNIEFGIDISITLKDESEFLLSVKIGLINGSIKPTRLVVNQEILYKIKEDSSRDIVYIRDKDAFKDKNGAPIPLNLDVNKLALAVYKNPEAPYTEQVKEAFVQTVIPNLESVNNVTPISAGSNESEYESLVSIIVNLHRNHPETYDKFQIIIKKLMPHFSSLIEIASKEEGVVPESPENESYLIVLEEENLKQKLSMQSVSSGDLKTLFLIAASLNMDDHSTLIIEEVENGMHPKRVVGLIEHLEAISKVKNMQILFTTHSPIVINKLSPPEVVLMERETENGSQSTLLEESEQISSIKRFLQEGGNLTEYLNTTKY